MRKLLFIYCLSLVTVIANAAMPYDYSTFFAGTATGSGVLEKATTSTVLTWNNATTNNGGTNPTIASSSLSYTDANSTKYIDNSPGTNITSITLASVVTITPARSSVFFLSSSALPAATTYYASAMINISAAPTTAVKIFNLNNSSVGNSAYGTVQIKGNVDGSGFQLNVAPGASGTASGYSSTLTYNNTHLVVLKFVYANITNSTDAYLYTNPNFGAEGSPNVSGLNNTSAVATIKGLVITQNLGLTGTVSGLRFGTSWADVVKGKLATPSATGATIGSLTSSGGRTNWTTVTNASSYTLTVYSV